MTIQVLLIADLTEERWHSMDRYADELFHNLAAISKNCDSPTFEFELMRPKRLFSGVSGRLGRFLTIFFRHAIYPLLLMQKKADIYHILDHSYAHLVQSLPASKTVITCHDLAPLVLNENTHSTTFSLWRHAIAQLAKARYVLADSGHTQYDLQQFLELQSSKIRLIHLGINMVNMSLQQQMASKLEIRKQLGISLDQFVVLHIGSCIPRKNIEVLIEALGKLSFNFTFVQIGGMFSENQTALLNKNNLLGKTIQIKSVNTAMPYYTVADIFVFPSLYEGFGLPPLEAMSCGLPVISSNATSLMEVVGDAGILVNHNDIQGFADAITCLYHDTHFRNELVSRGLSRVQLFPWQQTAEKTLLVYKEMALHTN